MRHKLGAFIHNRRKITVQCPNCGFWNEANANFCEECGFELKNVERGSKPVTVKPATQPQVSPPNVPPPKQQLEPAPELDSSVPAYTGARLVLTSTGSIFRLGVKTTIGREDPRLDIDFEGYPDGQFVSGNHAQIVQMNGAYYVEDMGSSNFTYVNDRKLAAGQLEPLKSGDTLRFGKISLKFEA
jgi:pSer/pThr/pTyr-binding forkhead associated (FHA) protein